MSTADDKLWVEVNRVHAAAAGNGKQTGATMPPGAEPSSAPL
ncbi:hypothetical protein [Mycobacterium ostraviense]|nr:hypothetical protein [Mycobacterium ostraviense]